VPTHSVQKSTGDQGVDVGFGYLKQVAAKPALTPIPHSFHAERAGAAVCERTGFCICGLRNRDHKHDQHFNWQIIHAFELFVTTYNTASKYCLSDLFFNAAGVAMKGLSGIILRIGAVLLGAAAYALIGMAIAAAG
jgi:hypothetical protein